MTRSRLPLPVVRMVQIVGGAALVLLTAGTLMITVFRTKWPPAIDAIRRFNRTVLNPAMLRKAGSKNWYASVVHHVGRKSGRQYATPVVTEAVGDRLYIPLPYGARTEGSENVLAAGGCTIESQGERIEATSPVIVPAEEASAVLSARSRRVLRLYGIDSYLRLDRA
ncbi:hypothetical protein [Cryobacterium zhongshanensis]|uniref:Uncharacterized protein n=1 Tax=Cryobacterium zhongshanensis TaxID=2928153 RepID=A0AA41QY55_9MICO|nr:hypothetical protein [Cryobacterium zhongshanensis]MCI4659906.1 hypothetical protein [Cryobacterium zhongshanensis]